jgi:aspartate-semialdehyde dehydrogenase
MKIAVVGATGLVGTKMLQVLEERKFPITELIPVASERSAGTSIRWRNQDWKVITAKEALGKTPEIALFSAGGATSLQWAEEFVKIGCVVIDNSSAWRMKSGIPLIVPEVNPEALPQKVGIIANPNCSTIQMVVALKPLHDSFKIKRIVVSTYQSVTGTGVKAVTQLMNERRGLEGPMAYPYPIDLNVIPQIDAFMDNGYTKEEMKMVNETRKILGDDSIKITSTTVRIPVVGGHSEAINVEFYTDFDIQAVRSLLKNSPGINLVDDPSKSLYPMPLMSHDQDDVFVGRIRRDESQENTLNLWVVSDNLRKGAATNAVQIAELLLKRKSD